MIGQLVSDLHVEHQRPSNDKAFFDALVPEEKPELLVVAGDLVPWAERARTKQALEALSQRFPNVLYVPGNHEYYGLNPRHAEEQLRDIRVPSNVEVVLDPRLVTFKGRRLLCGTMWYSKQEVEDTGCINPKTGTWIKNGRLFEFSDFHHVRHLYPWCYQTNGAFRALLEKHLQEGDLVVSHHLPSNSCTPQRFLGEIDNCFFVSSQEDLIEQRKQRLWLHGHTHNDVRVMVGETRILANPHAYPGERKKQGLTWDPFRATFDL